MDLSLIGKCLAAGVLSTVSMDLGATAARKLGLTAGVPLEFVAKWFGHIFFEGKVVHSSIAAAPDVKGGMPLVMACHYAIGITLTVVFWTILRQLPWKLEPAVLVGVAVGFGILTNVFPWLFMFPSMGFGAFGKDGPPELMLLRSSFINHVAFGLGLAWTALALGRVKA
jgi:hypothetical protein